MLPAAATHFKSALTDEESTSIRTTRWLLQHLEEALGHHLKSVCKHRKYGTILYRVGDLLHALLSTLGCKCAGQCTALPSTTCNKIPLKEAIEVVEEEINNEIHQQVGKFLSQEPWLSNNKLWPTHKINRSHFMETNNNYDKIKENLTKGTRWNATWTHEEYSSILLIMYNTILYE